MNWRFIQLAVFAFTVAGLCLLTQAACLAFARAGLPLWPIAATVFVALALLFTPERPRR